MKVVILTNQQGNQIALANKIAKHADVAAVVISRNIPRHRPRTRKRMRLLLNAIAARTVGHEFVDAWFRVLLKYETQFPNLPTENVIKVQNVNDPGTVEAIEICSPDLVVVSGTNLVGRRVIEISQKRGGIVNLHSGISPYVRGGPNCTNWCLAKNWFHLIGNTVMWLDSGIDTGNIMVTEQTVLDGSETLFDLHWKVMEHAHAVYAGVIAKMSEGKELPNIRQSEIDGGAHFNSVDWGVFEMRQALNNFRKNFRDSFEDPGPRKVLESELMLFPLNRD